MNILIAYFSHGGENLVDGKIVDLMGQGNTKKAALALEESLKEKGLKANVFEIEPLIPYPHAYAETNARSRLEHEEGAITLINDGPNGFEHYDVVFLGYPNWYGTIPAPILAFLRDHNFKGKMVIPFVTHGGQRFLYSLADVQKEATGAEVIEGFAIDAAYIDQAKKVTSSWVNEYGMIIGVE
ncbi:MAG: flavodoxin [Candidatus Enteromonas sp.]|nr:flavodoxin [Candidatus Enteromonas sp.]MDY6094237.1 flavodoxin [Candidatus Enteromonas sp.]